MTYYITALTNNVAKLIVDETRTRSKEVADLVAAHYRSEGYIVICRSEG